jgi:hypothetical protein
VKGFAIQLDWSAEPGDGDAGFGIELLEDRGILGKRGATTEHGGRNGNREESSPANAGLSPPDACHNRSRLPFLLHRTPQAVTRSVSGGVIAIYNPIIISACFVNQCR